MSSDAIEGRWRVQGFEPYGQLWKESRAQYAGMKKIIIISLQDVAVGWSELIMN